MTTFKFNFSGEDTNIADDAVTNQNIQWLESLVITPSNQLKDIDLMVDRAKMFTCGDIEIGHVIISDTTFENSQIQNDAIENIVKITKKEHSDLVPGKYEGGLKIWECTSDLVEYFEDNKEKIRFENKLVLDLGCGTGILGIYAFMNKANITFQDYNKEVLEHVTIPNVLLNIEEDKRDEQIKRCKFYSGDWESFNNKCQDVFDIIITSETIYNTCNYDKLVGIFLNRLSKNGTVYVAAKTYYFGVGGGTRQFEQVVEDNGSLNSEVCWKSSGGIQREILKITRKMTHT